MSWLIQASICLIFFYAGFCFCLKDKTGALTNRFFLLFALVLSVVIPFISIPIFPKEIVSGTTQYVLGINSSPVESTSILNWKSIVFGIYFIGFAVSLLVFIRRFFSLYRIISKGTKERFSYYTKVYTSQVAISSFLNYVFIPAEKANEISDFELYHEQAHVQQKHSLDVLLISIFQITFWFNPIVFLYKKSLVEIHEYLADEQTLKSFGKQPYLDFLSDKMKLQFESQLVLRHSFYSLIKKRIIMMNSEKRLSKWRYVVMLPLVILLLCLFCFKTYAVHPDPKGDSVNKKANYPSIPAHLEGKNYDTIFIFDPVMKTETIKYLEYSESLDLDTIYTFDPVSKKETMEIVPRTNEVYLNNENPNRVDSIWVFDSKTKTESLTVVRYTNGVADTLKQR